MGTLHPPFHGHVLLRLALPHCCRCYGSGPSASSLFSGLPDCRADDDPGRPHRPPLMAALLASVSAALFGVGDFLGGLASRRVRAVLVAAWSQLIGLTLIVGLVFGVLSTAHPVRADFVWGAAGGVVGPPAWCCSTGRCRPDR